MTLYAPDGLQIIWMERFEDYTSAIDCEDDDGSISLTLKSEAAFKYPVQIWAWINGAAEKKFFLIANHDSCGPQDERQPYLYVVLNVQYNRLLILTYMILESHIFVKMRPH